MARIAEIVAWMLAPAMFGAMIAVTGPTNLMGDFRAFYCAGVVIAHGSNPYLEEPLHACELRAEPPAIPEFLPAVTVPAPLPPVALLGFVPLSFLPFPAAATLYTAFLIAAMSGAVVLFARATGVESTLLNLAFAAITATQSYFLGQPMPFVFLALAAAAVFVRNRRWIPASACAAASIAEPHIALPVLLAMCVALPRTRLPIVAFSVLLALIGIAALGLPATVTYVRDVIPAHALSNAFEWQFSLTSILTSLGLGAAVAVRWGEAMYAVMVILGVAIAYRLWRNAGDGAAIVLVPPAFAVFGGVHVHLQQIAVAFPALLTVYARYPRERTLAATAIAFVMIPWNVVSASIMTGFTPLLVGWFGYVTVGPRRGLVLTVIAMLIAVSLLVLALAGYGPGDAHFVARAHSPGALAEESWGDFSRAVLARTSLLMQWLRVPVLTGLAIGLFAVTRAALRPVEAQ